MDTAHFPVKQPEQHTNQNQPVELQSKQTNSTPPVVTVHAQRLSKIFRSVSGTILAVDEVSFAFTEGQFVAILGPSGCGKSTLLYLLSGLDKPTSGELTIDGVDVNRLSGGQEQQFRRQKLGFVFQSFHLLSRLTALENVLLPMELTGGTSDKAMHSRARTLLRQVGISDDRHSARPGKLSGGQQQRIAIARALANDPRVILADEPTGNLDSATGKLIVQMLRQLAEQERTVIVVTHDPGIAEVADVRLEMRDGRVKTIENSIPSVSKPFSQEQ
ncbi:MAG: ABC transporter ATP-binding protein [Ktedonobacteraceae bacterium]|nr:ABC transporter ATP-binding protein [Ktedonobacteraceae bacterium]MBO0790207.1 ABC transporter ATP-binding protein [Ktedonobacteraceae bacterium]